MMTHEDILHQIPDYVLGYLPSNQLNVVEKHVAECPACRQAMAQERKLTRLVRKTIDNAAKPDPVRIRTLMPEIPQQQLNRQLLNGWQRQLAPVILIILLFAGGLMINNLLPAGSVPAFVATAHAATATSTHTPTATMAQARSENFQVVEKLPEINNQAIKASAALPSPDADQPVITPDPLPTPVAAIRQVVQ